ncbi:2-phosphosulfolactate phosphatase [Hymenobacter cheonanensis]|uniref:2-phosphosulfolactate phosphatase n=1 Tax=Hymenobacter sp. CA2-7 TaxID=3063993 RepID=UPI0027129182|nr:2-phosphosulfolactate phosphatase [Hymenobacter sp. CA2-7]MDO7885677.1 2-phosphosulfolactate phosphatase [Hymenobacter sp. CA2-7]
MKLDVCFSPELLPLYDLRGRVAVIVDVLRATSTIVTALAAGVTEVFPTATLDECAALGRDQGCITAAERDGVAAAGFDLGNSPFGFLDGKLAVKGRALAISTTNGTMALHRSLTAEAIVCGAFLNLSAVVDFVVAQQRDVLVVCAGWKGSFCLEDSIFGGALAERLAPLGFDIASSDAGLAALHLWQHAKPTWPEYLLQSAAVRRLNALEAHDDFTFCMHVDTHPDILPVWRTDRLVRG